MYGKEAYERKERGGGGGGGGGFQGGERMSRVCDNYQVEKTHEMYKRCWV